MDMSPYFWMTVIIVATFPFFVLRRALIALLNGEKIMVGKIVKRAFIEWSIIAIIGAIGVITYTYI